ncbi:MAG: NAD+ synthase [Fimbriimonadaceae bacterium]|nr:NAD+ synthase [Fimbriimonadaceae bacterium]
MPLDVYRAPAFNPDDEGLLALDIPTVVEWLTDFVYDEMVRRRGIQRAVIGLSGGVDSAVSTYLAVRALGAENVHAIRMPYRISSRESLDHARMVVDDLGIPERTISITGMVDGYLAEEPDTPAHRLGNVCARSRMIVLFDQSAKLGALPIGTGNKSERLLGYYTWHADDSPPINPLGDLFKTQVWDLARALGVPSQIVEKPATADLAQGQTDEGDFGITYHRADRILHFLTRGYPPRKVVELGFPESEVEIVWKRLAGSHWKRRPPTVAMLSNSAIGEYYLRPVDY